MAPRRLNRIAHAARRDEFIEAGRRLIQTRGYERFTIEDLLAEVGASKGAFYHYFDSKPALLEAVVERFADEVVAAAASVVTDPRLPAVEKLERYFAAIAARKTAERHFLEELLRVWYSDENAIVREKTRRQTIRLVAPHIAAIIRQGIAEGTIALVDPDEMARVVLALLLDAGDEAGELYLARRNGTVTLDAVRRRVASYRTAIERLLGLQPGSVQLVDDETLQTWFG
jgi:AcrR family transcriptional regulator